MQQAWMKRNANRIVVGTPEGKKPLTSHKRTREDNIKMFWKGIITYLHLLRHVLLRKENIKEEYTHTETQTHSQLGYVISLFLIF
jgi:hypothetical protein